MDYALIEAGKQRNHWGTVRCDFLATLYKLTIQHQHGIPGAIEGEVAAEAKAAIQNRLVRCVKRSTQTLGWKMPPGREHWLQRQNLPSSCRASCDFRNGNFARLTKMVMRSAYCCIVANNACGLRVRCPSSSAQSKVVKASGAVSSASSSNVKVVPIA